MCFPEASKTYLLNTWTESRTDYVELPGKNIINKESFEWSLVKNQRLQRSLQETVINDELFSFHLDHVQIQET